MSCSLDVSYPLSLYQKLPQYLRQRARSLVLASWYRTLSYSSESVDSILKIQHLVFASDHLVVSFVVQNSSIKAWWYRSLQILSGCYCWTLAYLESILNSPAFQSSVANSLIVSMDEILCWSIPDYFIAINFASYSLQHLFPLLRHHFWFHTLHLEQTLDLCLMR